MIDEFTFSVSDKEIIPESPISFPMELNTNKDYVRKTSQHKLNPRSNLAMDELTLSPSDSIVISDEPNPSLTE